MYLLFCEGCDEQLKKYRGGKEYTRLVVAKKNKTGKWVEVNGRKLKEGVEKDEKIFLKCLICNHLNEIPEDLIQRAIKDGKR